MTPLTSEIQDAILWSSFIFILQSCHLRPMCMVISVAWWMCSSLAQISNVLVGVMCTSWSHLTARCSSACASAFFQSHACTAFGGPVGLSVKPSTMLCSCLHMSTASIKIFNFHNFHYLTSSYFCPTWQ